MVLFSNAMAALVAAGLAVAATPEGFEPQVDGNLIVAYDNVAAVDGAKVQKSR